jgi:hypothetical protein
MTWCAFAHSSRLHASLVRRSLRFANSSRGQLLAFFVLEVGSRNGEAMPGVVLSALPGKLEDAPTASPANPNLIVVFICIILLL